MITKRPGRENKCNSSNIYLKAFFLQFDGVSVVPGSVQRLAGAAGHGAGANLRAGVLQSEDLLQDKGVLKARHSQVKKRCLF